MSQQLDTLDRLFLARNGAVIKAVEGQTVTLDLQVPIAALYRALAAARSENPQTLGGDSAESNSPHTQEESS